MVASADDHDIAPHGDVDHGKWFRRRTVHLHPVLKGTGNQERKRKKFRLIYGMKGLLYPYPSPT